MDIATLIAIGLSLILTVPGAIKSRREARIEEIRGATALCEVEHDCTLLRKLLKVSLIQSKQRIEIEENTEDVELRGKIP